MTAGVTLQVAMELVVMLGVVMQHETPGIRIDRDLLDPRNNDKRLSHLLKQFGIALCR